MDGIGKDRERALLLADADRDAHFRCLW
jgi:hypothetical protein